MSLEGTKYFLWLCHLVEDREHKHYRKMIKVLHGVPYVWSVPNDDNRGGDGIHLRERYCEEKGIELTSDIYKPSPSVLEVLIGLAKRMDAQLYEPEYGNRVSVWFWEFIKNLDLDLYTDARWTRKLSEDDICEILDTFLHRKYDSYGRGGIFPLRKRPKKDQRDVEIWYQMQAWMGENYPN